MNRSPFVLAWDVDGVLVARAPYGSGWWMEMEKPEARVLARAFFDAPVWQQCLRGEKEAAEALYEFAGQQGAPHSYVPHILRAWRGITRIMHGSADLFRSTAQEGFINVIASNQDTLRATLLPIVLNLEVPPAHWFFSCHVGIQKPEAGFYGAIQNHFPDIPPERFMMIDDMGENLVAPHAMGWQVHHFRDLEGLIAALPEL